MGALANAFSVLIGGTRARPPLPRSSSAPAGALYSQQFYSPGQPIHDTWDGEVLLRKGYQRTMYAWRCIDKLATTISERNFVAGDAVSRKARPRARLSYLLGRAPGSPNPQWSAAMLWRFSVASYLVFGKFAWLKEFDSAGRVVGVWPLLAHRLKPKMADPDSQSTSYFAGYEYGTRGENGYQEFKLDQVVYAWRPSLKDYRQAESPLQFAAYEINISQLISLFDAAFLQNGGVPAHLVVHGQFAQREERQAFRRQFRQRFSGPRNAGGVMFAERDIDPGDVTGSIPDPIVVHTLGRSQKDSETTQLRESKIQDMCVAFGVPLSILGDSTRSKYTNMDMDRKNFWESCQSLMVQLADLVNVHLAPSFSATDIGWFDVSDVPELAPALKYTTEDVAAGLVTKDEWRAERGLGPLPEQPETTTPAAPADDPSEGSGSGAGQPTQQPASASNVVPIRRSPHAATLGAHLRRWSADITEEVERRKSGGRGRRAQVRAAEDITTAFDAPHWKREAVRRFEPTLRALGVIDIDRYVEDVTAAVLDQLDDGSAVADLAEFTEVSGYIGAVAVADVQAALLGLHDGSLTADQALAQLGSTG